MSGASHAKRLLTIGAKQLDNYQRAAKMIEADGEEAIISTATFIGASPAMALLVAHIRRRFGSMNTFPARPEIDDKVKEILIAAGLFNEDVS